MSASTTEHSSGDTRRTGPLQAAKQRTGAGPIGRVGPLLAVLLTLLGLALLRDGVFAPAGSSTTGWPADQPSWLGVVTSGLDGTAAASWMVGLGVVVALVGLYLLLVALRRRTRRALALRGASGAYLMPNDVARRAGAAAEDVDGVLSARASATRRRVIVTATTTGGPGSAGRVREEVSAAVKASLAALERPPAVRVRTASSGGSSAGGAA